MKVLIHAMHFGSSVHAASRNCNTSKRKQQINNSTRNYFDIKFTININNFRFTSTSNLPHIKVWKLSQPYSINDLVTSFNKLAKHQRRYFLKSLTVLIHQQMKKLSFYYQRLFLLLPISYNPSHSPR